jgi:hypothetical protein
MEQEGSFLSQMGGFMRGAGAKAPPPGAPSEETAPDRSTGSDAREATELATFKVPPFPKEGWVDWEFFIDGVQRTVVCGIVSVDDLEVPIHIAHLVAGVMRRANRELEPYRIVEALVLMLPLGALRARDPRWPRLTPPGRELSYRGRIYDLVRAGRPVYTDTSVSLAEFQAGTPRRLLEAGDLVRTGAIRDKALNRSRTLLRVLELALLWRVRTENPEAWILIDGPVAPLLKYDRLVDPQLDGLKDLADPVSAFEFYQRIVGAVKNVEIIPQQGLEAALSTGDSLVVPAYQFSNIVKDEDGVAREMVSVFVWLRRELASEISVLWSAVSGLARLDIPIPALVGDEMRSTWVNMLEEGQLNLNDPNSTEAAQLNSILLTAAVERWPVPQVAPQRMLTEFYPIAETERWLSSTLRSSYELANILNL